MGLPSVFQIGRTGMQASKAAIATTGHNIANANTEGYSRQRVQTETDASRPAIGSKALVGSGTQISRVERMNDEYIERQVRDAGSTMSEMEEKDLVLRQTEDIFNEMNGEGLNRLISRFFNDFRKLSNEPENEAVRQAVRESTQAMTNDFHRLRSEVEDVRKHIDSRVEGYSREINSLADTVKDLNLKIMKYEVTGTPPNDLLDQRDVALKKIASYMDIATHKDGEGNVVVDIRGVGPLVVGGLAESFSVERTPADDRGKPENALDLKTTASANGVVTHNLKGGKLGALLEVRDRTLSTILDRLDDLAYNISETVNQVHRQGFNRFGVQGVNFFKPIMAGKDRAAEFIQLSDEVKANVSNIASAAIADAPGDNRIALAIAGLQSQGIMNHGQANFDDFYNSIVADVGVTTNRNRSSMNQQKDIMTQLNKMRDQIAGVSIDEETANLMQFQHTFDASAKVIQVADEMLKTVLELRR